jgi:hypothetical protein
MALPPNAVEQLSRRPSNDARSPAWFGQLLMFSATVFFLTVAIFLGLQFGYHAYLTNQNADFQQQIDSFAVQVPADQQERLVAFYSQLQNLNTLLDKHVIVSQVFPWIENSTITTVSFTKISLNTGTQQIALSGLARTLADFSQQLRIFQDRSTDVQRVSFSNVSVSPKGLWQFDIVLFMRPTFFLAAPPTAGSAGGGGTGSPASVQPSGSGSSPSQSLPVQTP